MDQEQVQHERENNLQPVQAGSDKKVYHRHGNKNVPFQLWCWTYLSLWKPSPWCSWWLVHGQGSYNPRPPALPYCVHVCADTDTDTDRLSESTAIRHVVNNFVTHTTTVYVWCDFSWRHFVQQRIVTKYGQFNYTKQKKELRKPLHFGVKLSPIIAHSRSHKHSHLSPCCLATTESAF